QLYGKAVAFWRKLAAEFPQDPSYRLELGHSLWQLADFHGTLEQYQDSERACREAIELFERLGPALFAEPALLREMVDRHIEFSSTLFALGKGEEAAQMIRRAVELADKLDKDVPDNRAYLVKARNRLANHLTSKQPEEAEKLLKANLALAGNASGLEGVHRGLACVFEATRRLPQAEESWRQAVKYAEQMARQHPTADGPQAVLVRDQRERARMISTKHPAEAEEIQRSAVLILNKLVTDLPHVPRYRRALGNALTDHVGFLKQLGRTADAEQACRQTIAVY